MKKWNLLAALCATAIFASSAQATVVNINFDDVPGNTLLNTAYGGLGVTFNDTAAVHLGLGGVTSQPNFASGMAGNDVTALVLTFDNYATSIGAYNVTNSEFTLRVYDVNGLLLGSSSAMYDFDHAFVAGVGNIKTAIFSTTSQYGIDDLSFEAAVPEPASMALIGLGMVGLTVTRGRSRRRNSSVEM